MIATIVGRNEAPPSRLDELLAEQASRLALGRLMSDEMLATIDRALDEGIWVDAFVDVLPPDPDPRFDQLQKTFRALLAARAITVPDRKQAFWRLVERHVAGIAAPDANPRAALQALIDAVYWEPEFRENTTKYVGDPVGLERLVGYHWSFDDVEGRPDDISVNGRYGAEAIEELKQIVRAEALRWLAEQQRPGPV